MTGYPSIFCQSSRETEMNVVRTEASEAPRRLRVVVHPRGRDWPRGEGSRLAIGTAAARRSKADLALERFAGQFLPLGLLLGGQHLLDLFVGAIVQFGHFLPGLLAGAGATLEEFAPLLGDVVLDYLDFFLLVGRDFQGGGDLLVCQGRRALLLQRDFLEPFRLFRFQNPEGGLFAFLG